MNLFGYVRVSDASQKEDRQMISMAEQGVPAKNIFVDKQSGKDFERKAYRAMIRRLRPGDCVILSSLDRFACNRSWFVKVFGNSYGTYYDESLNHFY